MILCKLCLPAVQYWIAIRQSHSLLHQLLHTITDTSAAANESLQGFGNVGQLGLLNFTTLVNSMERLGKLCKSFKIISLARKQLSKLEHKTL